MIAMEGAELHSPLRPRLGLAKLAMHQHKSVANTTRIGNLRHELVAVSLAISTPP